MKRSPEIILAEAIRSTEKVNALLRDSVGKAIDPETFRDAVGAAFNMAHEIQKLNRFIKKQHKKGEENADNP